MLRALWRRWFPRPPPWSSPRPVTTGTDEGKALRARLDVVVPLDLASKPVRLEVLGDRFTGQLWLEVPYECSAGMMTEYRPVADLPRGDGY